MVLLLKKVRSEFENGSDPTNIWGTSSIPLYPGKEDLSYLSQIKHEILMIFSI